MEKKKLLEELKKEWSEVEQKFTAIVNQINNSEYEKALGDTQMCLLIDQESALHLYLRAIGMRITNLESELGLLDDKPKSKEPKDAKKEQHDVDKKVNNDDLNVGKDLEKILKEVNATVGSIVSVVNGINKKYAQNFA